MDFPLASRAASDLRNLLSSPSTNSELLALAADPTVVDGTVLVTLDQTRGRGRLDRSWVAPAGSALAVSVLVRGGLTRAGASWLPLAAALAMVEALDPLVAGRSGIKWPNDVLLDGDKVCGVLVDVVPGATDVVVGAGLNLRQSKAELPVPSATSLAASGVEVDDRLIDGVLERYLTALSRLTSARGLPTVARGIADRSATIGREVRIELPGGRTVSGTATRLDDEGRLELRLDDGSVEVFAAGDVVHARRV